MAQKKAQSEPPSEISPFNLWEDPWIRVSRLDGSSALLSIQDCLAHADSLGDLIDSSPLVVASTHRLLVAILQFMCAPTSLDAIRRLLTEGHFEPALLAAFAAAHADRFRLFDPMRPFLQTADVDPNLRDSANSSVSRLFAELPTETNRTLFHHMTDADHAICPACCAAGLLSQPAFTVIGGMSYRAGLNGGPPPIYTFPVGENLHETLVLSLAAPETQSTTADPDRARQTPWTDDNLIGEKTQKERIGYVESLLFMPRRVRLFSERASQSCTRCGANTSWCVSRIFFKAGHWRNSRDEGPWDDPFVAFRVSFGTRKAVTAREGRSLWREFSPLFLLRDDAQGKRPAIISQMHALKEETQSIIRTRHLWIRADKAKMIEWGDETLETPVILIHAENASENIDTALRHAEETRQTMSRIFRTFAAPSNGSKKKKPFASVQNRLERDYWATLGPIFRLFIRDLALAYGSPDNATPEIVLRNWDRDLRRISSHLFSKAIDQIGGRADTIRARVKAKHRFEQFFHQTKTERSPNEHLPAATDGKIAG